MSYCRGTATTLILVGPAHEPASIQRWPQRLMLTAAALGALILIGLFVDPLGAGLTERGVAGRPAQGAP